MLLSSTLVTPQPFILVSVYIVKCDSYELIYLQAYSRLLIQQHSLLNRHQKS